MSYLYHIYLISISSPLILIVGGYLRGYWSFYLETERGRCDSDMDQRTIASHMSKLSEREVQQKINMLKSESVKDIEKLRVRGIKQVLVGIWESRDVMCDVRWV